MQGGPKCLPFGSLNTGYLFLNWPKFGSDHKKSKKVVFFELFFDHQIQVIYSWTGQILVPKVFRWTFPKVAFTNRFWRKKSKCPLREAADGRTNERTDERTHTWRTWKIWRALPAFFFHISPIYTKKPKSKIFPPFGRDFDEKSIFLYIHFFRRRPQQNTKLILRNIFSAPRPKILSNLQLQYEFPLLF